MTTYFYFILVYYYSEKSKFQVVQTFDSTHSKMFHLKIEISRKCVKEDVTFFVRFNNNETIEINTMNAFTTITVKHCNEDMIMFSGNNFAR